ncbi:RNA polymerase sigma 70 [Candidatus Phycorickettsia trachydisci]|uniref:RNA polymerase sigma factor n=1 Tax=Candidatus Phycorickettsia trachydisci TaxID=2115978 RepID=A0A2P1P819_9RICK|nr:RNA polymerase factor sigma-32 [Candidatus Phycorickettsia trachydisci]AVP87406.1 RNA polymerase sigma 70 [Candidatus Phycorickettsia trachydisci]
MKQDFELDLEEVSQEQEETSSSELVPTEQVVELPSLSYENSLQRYLSEVNRIPSLSAEEEFLLAKNLLEHSDKKAAGRLITSHLKLVAKIALSYRHYGLPINELISEGNLGLIHAVKKYNPDLGFRLSTYAVWWIKANIQDYILKSWSLVKIGSSAMHKKLFFNLARIKNKISSMYSREVNDQDYENIAKELGLAKKDVIEVDERLFKRDMSLNQPVQDDQNSAQMIDCLVDTSPDQENTLVLNEENMIKKQALVQGLKSLNERELYIIKHRKLKNPASTLEELSNKFSISKERVRQIEGRAFEKLQNFVLSKFAEVQQNPQLLS